MNELTVEEKVLLVKPTHLLSDGEVRRAMEIRRRLNKIRLTTDEAHLSDFERLQKE
jgi:hypothetical protein